MFSGEAKLYFFSASWCGYCKRFKPEWEKLKAEPNLGIELEEVKIYFPHFSGNSVILDTETGYQEQTWTVPRTEPQVEKNKRGQLISFGKGGPVDVSKDGGKTWTALGQLNTISQPDLIKINDGRLLFCYSGKNREDEWLLLSEDGYDINESEPVKIFQGIPDGRIDSRGKAMAIEKDGEILTVLYEAASENRGLSRIYLVRTSINSL